MVIAVQSPLQEECILYQTCPEIQKVKIEIGICSCKYKQESILENCKCLKSSSELINE